MQDSPGINDNPPTVSPARPPLGGDAQRAVEVQERLRSSWWGHGFRNVTVTVDRGQVRIEGRVASYHLKQIAQSIAAQESPGLAVLNDARVSSAAPD
ncbi:BON domain-containing protein [Botrimarina sp.]|uniref:BON domain-containing protein n=1 Tax=Botrimarina sp. TaxID=2795802 RepID=UPI0032F0850E